MSKKTASIAIGLMLGCQEARPVAVVAAPAAVSAAAAPVRSREEVARDAASALEYQHSTLRGRCRARPGERHAFTLDVTFDANGVQLARGVLEGRHEDRGLGMCVSEALQALKVPPPGAVTQVEVPLVLP